MGEIAERHDVHFICHDVTGFIGIEPAGELRWLTQD